MTPPTNTDTVPADGPAASAGAAGGRRRRPVPKWLAWGLAAGGMVVVAMVLWHRVSPHNRLVMQIYRTAAFSGAPVLAIGDSITFQSAPSRLCGDKLLNAGVPGDQIGDLLARAPLLARLMTPRLLVVAIGVNDSRTGHMDIDAWRTQYRAVLDYFPKSELVLVEVNPVDIGHPRYIPQHDRDFIAAQNAAIRTLAAETGARVVAAPASAPTMDGLHPDRQGVGLWQQRLASAACAG